MDRHLELETAITKRVTLERFQNLEKEIDKDYMEKKEFAKYKVKQIEVIDELRMKFKPLAS